MATTKDIKMERPDMPRTTTLRARLFVDSKDVPSDAPLSLHTPEGRRVTICPAETEAKLTCAQCELCANPTRKAIVGFKAHGQFSKHVDQLVQLRRTA